MSTTRRSAIQTATSGCSRRSRPGSPAGNGPPTSPPGPHCWRTRPSITARSRRSPRRTTGGTGTRRTCSRARPGAAKTRPLRRPTATWPRSSTSSSHPPDASRARRRCDPHLPPLRRRVDAGAPPRRLPARRPAPGGRVGHAPGPL